MLGAVVVSTVMASQADAQQLEEIIVTAERRETNLQDTPISVTQFGADELVQRGASDLEELAAFTPNLVVGSGPANYQSIGRYAIRGIGIEGGSPAVGVYVDEVYLPGSRVLSVFDIERIEVLRGPQGTSFGRNTIGGAIQYVTAKPNLDGFSGSVNAVLGDLDREDLEAVFNIPIGDTVAARVSLGTQQRGGFVRDRLNDVDKGEVQRDFVRAQLRWQPSDSLTVDLKYDELEAATNGRSQLTVGYDNNSQFAQLASLSGGGPFNDSILSIGNYDFAGHNQPDYTDNEFAVTQINIDWDISDTLNLRSISAYNESENDAATDWDNTPLNVLWVPSGGKEDGYSQEFRLSGQPSDRLAWTAGLYYSEQESTESFSHIKVGNAPGFTINNPNNTITSEAVYATVSYLFSDRLEGTLGARSTTEEDTTVGQESSDYSDTSPQVGLNFRATDDILYYAKASKGFRAGGRSSSGGLTQLYDPEEAWTYEFGARMEFADRSVRVNPTVFFTDWEDIQFYLLVPAPGTVAVLTQNAGTASLQGFELETEVSVSDRLTFRGAMSYLDSEYDEVNNAVQGQIYAPGGAPFFRDRLIVPNLCDGDDPPVTASIPDSVLLTPANISQWTCSGKTDLQRAPELKFSVGLRYDAPLSNGGSITTSVDYSYTDKMNVNSTETDLVHMPSYSLLNARVQYNAPGENWSAAIFGTNLTDEFYLRGGLDHFTTVGVTMHDPALPRQMGVNFKYNF